MDFRKNTQISSFMKIRPVGAELCHVDRRRDGQTDKQRDMTMLIAAFWNFANAPENKFLIPFQEWMIVKLSSWLEASEREKIFQFHPINYFNSKLIKKEATVCFKLSIMQ